MRLPKFRWALLAGALFGGIVPLLFFTLAPFREFIVTGRGIFFWPSGIWLMATDGHEHEIGAYEIIGMSIAVNIVLYAIIFSLIWCVGWIFRAWRASLRDGTTI
jgi:hypothetical protein